MAAADRYRRPRRSTLARRQAARDDHGRVYGSLPRLLTPAQEATVRKLWGTGIGQQEMARIVGIGRDHLIARLRDQLADLPRPGRGRCSGRRTLPPTPEEIAARAAELRHGWTEERWLGLDPDDDRDRRPLEENAR